MILNAQPKDEERSNKKGSSNTLFTIEKERYKKEDSRGRSFDRSNNILKVSTTFECLEQKSQNNPKSQNDSFSKNLLSIIASSSVLNR